MKCEICNKPLSDSTTEEILFTRCKEMGSTEEKFSCCYPCFWNVLKVVRDVKDYYDPKVKNYAN